MTRILTDHVVLALLVVFAVATDFGLHGCAAPMDIRPPVARVS